ncbi:response regulator [Marispirochaeta sp.]|jgi:DNA-binding response OmpR family regulator|uniref:response regulator n=1 Tax=Marispirochaeta sp. TaxID=2038653 RepID=UPI0029C71A3C|nr:response regulator [Marispirochaeta sp.]
MYFWQLTDKNVYQSLIEGTSSNLGEASLFNTQEKLILIVEDEAIIALAEKRTLEKAGYTVHVANNGERAMELTETLEKIDLILMDIDLGQKPDGTETAEQILAEHEIPIMFLSSHTEPEIVGRTEGITSYGYIVKNSGNTVLLASIRMAFRLHKARQAVKEHMEMQDLILRVSECLTATRGTCRLSFSSPRTPWQNSPDSTAALSIFWKRIS